MWSRGKVFVAVVKGDSACDECNLVEITLYLLSFISKRGGGGGGGGGGYQRISEGYGQVGSVCVCETLGLL